MARPGKHDIFASQIRTLVALVLCFAVLPGALLVTVGVLVLVFSHRASDTVFGVLIVSLAATLIAGIAATFSYVRRGTSLAKLQGQFVQRVSHDLRTPLTSIRMFVETLQDGRLKDPDKIRECLDVLSDETGRLSALVERLLKWASMEAGKRIYNPLRVAPERIIDTALQALEPQIKLSQIEGRTHIKREIDARLPMLEVDPAAMSEALLNVLQNALRYTGAQKELRVACAYSEREREVVITIADNGPGIPKHEQRRIFEKFYRVVDPANPNVEGTGLGLAMVHHIVRAHQGRIDVESDIGRGAAFHIRLPAVGPAEGASTAPEEGVA